MTARFSDGSSSAGLFLLGEFDVVVDACLLVSKKQIHFLVCFLVDAVIQKRMVQIGLVRVPVHFLSIGESIVQFSVGLKVLSPVEFHLWLLATTRLKEKKKKERRKEEEE